MREALAGHKSFQTWDISVVQPGRKKTLASKYLEDTEGRVAYHTLKGKQVLNSKELIFPPTRDSIFASFLCTIR